MTQPNSFEQTDNVMNFDAEMQKLPVQPVAKKAVPHKVAIFGSVAGAFMIGALSLTSIGSLSAAAASAQAPAKENTSHTITMQQPARTTSASAMQGKEVTSVSTVSYGYVDMARQAAIRHGISPDLFVRQIQQESGFNPGASSPAGAVGIAQFLPSTAASMGVNPYDPASALDGAARWMSQLSAQFGGNYAKALAAYNAGPGAVYRAQSLGGGNWLAYMPYESQHYVAVIMG